MEQEHPGARRPQDTILGRDMVTWMAQRAQRYDTLGPRCVCCRRELTYDRNPGPTETRPTISMANQSQGWTWFWCTACSPWRPTHEPLSEVGCVHRQPSGDLGVQPYSSRT